MGNVPSTFYIFHANQQDDVQLVQASSSTTLGDGMGGVYSSIRLFVYSSIRLFVYSSIRLFVYSSIRAF
ncbi:MAG: hypothetical protein OXC45_07490, partial [Gemmatimonadetes bacterium]|nr:hypothetical protein [Gemmatimonadota bacterium]